jgi:NDP-sugar pyrophosphorylase family protein
MAMAAVIKIKIHYALEKAPLGTAGALKNSEKYVKNSPWSLF